MFGAAVAGFFFWQQRRCVVAEDTVAITVDGDGFIKRVLPSGRHLLRPFEKIDFILSVKPSRTGGYAAMVVTADGIPLTLNWSLIYACEPGLITEHLNRRLRGLLLAEAALSRHIDIALRRIVGGYPLPELFKPAIRERIERQVAHLVADKVKVAGLTLTSLDLQVFELPGEVAEAFNKAKAIETLDGTIRRLDPTTRDIVRGVYQLDEILHWDHYLPVPSRRTMKRLEAANG
jgi:regulator of protease activity HflC (stomatin/prohibitin superfamily)